MCTRKARECAHFKNSMEVDHDCNPGWTVSA